MGKGNSKIFEHQEETQRIETPPSSPCGKDKDNGNGDKLGFMGDTVPFDEDAWLGEQINTQVVDIECENEEFPHYDETQAVALGPGTQEVSLSGERQWLKASDCVATQLLDLSDSEVAVDSDDDVTDVLEDDSELSDGDSRRRGRNLLSDKDNILHAERIKLADVSDALSKERSSGNVAKFTSVRTAALRASGLAARVATPKLPNSDSRSVLTNTSAGNSVGEEVEQQFIPSILGEKANELRMGNKTARKLFPDDSPKEKFPAVDCDDELARLSYVDSQEPGDASQANALNFVEKLINDSCLNFEVEVYHRKRTNDISKFVPSVKGPQLLAKKVRQRVGAVGNDEGEVDHGERTHEMSKLVLSATVPQVLAKKVSYRGGAVGIDIFDLDENREDEGGGEWLSDSRRKEEFFGTASHARGSSTMSRELKGKSVHRSDAGLVNATEKRRVHSDSRLLRHSLIKNGRKVQTDGKETNNNFVNELGQVSEDNNVKTSAMHEVVDVGPDTQIAAEAIDALCLGDGGELDADRNPLIGKKLSLGEEQRSSSGGVVTQQSKRRKRVEVVEEDVGPPKTRTKKARSIPAKACKKIVECSSNVDELVVSSTDKRQGELSDKLCAMKLLNQSSRGRAEVSSYPKQRRSTRISRGQPNDAGRNSDSAFDTPMKSKMPPKPPKNVSPICIGDEYLRQSLKNSSKSNCLREFRSLISPSAEPVIESKMTRKRRDLGSIRVLFSQHLDEDVTKHQKKILARFGISEASSMTEATHFIANEFMRTRNMLEAIASGKPVVTTQWLKSIEQVNIYIDEDTYVLRDSKKEKEFGFNMSVSLARARHAPLLQGRRVFITPNTKPGKETLTTLVKAVHGQAVERLGRSALKDDKVPDNLLVLSCVEDYDICVPFLEKGADVYSSELLLNGIVTQKLEYERYCLFVDRRTRSTRYGLGMTKAKSNPVAGK